MEDFEYGLNAEEQPGGMPDAVETDGGGPGALESAAAMDGDGSPGEGSAPAAAGTGQGGPEQPLEEPPKRKRASRKKADKPEEFPAEDAAAPMKDGGAPSDTGLPEEDRLEPETGGILPESLDMVGLAGQGANGAPAGEPPEPGDTGAALDGGPSGPEPAPPPEQPRQAGPRPRAGRPADGHSPLLSLKLNDLDRGLTEQERREWNDIYASFRSKSVLTGRIVGVDGQAFNVRSRETGQVERRTMYCAAIISYRVKVLIPETEMWMPGEERPAHVLRNMSGAEIDYVILDVDREGGVAIGSRRMGAMIRQRAFDTARGGHTPGERLTCRVLTVGPSRCLLECGGRDLTLRYQEMSYASYSDLREKYHPGESLDCILKEYDRASGRMVISVKEAAPNPFDGARRRHPLGSRRQAVISGKYGGGVFCTMPDDTTCLCLYAAQHTDRDFQVGDNVILVIVKYDFERSLIYGRILSKW